VDYMTRDNKLKIKVKPDDIEGIAWALAYPIYMKFANDNPNRAIPITSFALELRGEIVLTVTASDDALALVPGVKDEGANV
jgi:hypothetical protein